MQRVPIHSISFRGEQAGPVEREVQRRISGTLLACGVRRAYLARVLLDQAPTTSVALCLVGGLDRGKQIVGAVADIVRELLHESQFLDTLFLSPEQEADLKKVAQAFFTSPELFDVRQTRAGSPRE